MGRPSEYQSEVAVLVCERISSGETIREIGRDPDMPAHTTLYRWMRENDEFRTRYARACEARAEFWADEIVEIAEDGSNDWIVRNKGKANEQTVLDHEHVSRSKLRIDARQWLMGKAAPKKYGEKVQQEISGPDGGPVEVAAVSDLDRAKALAAMIARTQATHSGG